MKYLKAPGDLMTADMAWHKAKGTSGEDWVWKGVKMTTSTQMTKPCSDLKLIGDRHLSDGTYKQFYHGSMNGYKFSCYTCHCDDFVTVGDDYPGSTGLHIHLLCFHGHQTVDYMQNNRNTHGVTLGEIDAKCAPAVQDQPEEDDKGFRLNRASTQSYPGNYDFNEDQRQHFDSNWDILKGHTAKDRQGTNWLETTAFTFVCNLGESSSKTVKGYSFNECSANNGSSFFDIEEYGSTQDDLCFNIENLKKLSNGNYDLIKAQHGYAVHTQFRKVKTTFYK